jgi:hypothetical protein
MRDVPSCRGREAGTTDNTGGPTMELFGVARSESFFRATAGRDVDKDDLRSRALPAARDTCCG